MFNIKVYFESDFCKNFTNITVNLYNRNNQLCYFSDNTSVTEVTVLNGSTFSENLTAILRCQVTGNPLPNVTWYFLSNETKQILQRQHRIVESSYTINTTNCMHTGIYECATENTVNGTKVMNSKQTELKVTCKYIKTLMIFLCYAVTGIIK